MLLLLIVGFWLMLSIGVAVIIGRSTKCRPSDAAGESLVDGDGSDTGRPVAA